MLEALGFGEGRFSTLSIVHNADLARPAPNSTNVLSCPVLSCPVLSCPVLSCVFQWGDSCCRILSCSVSQLMPQGLCCRRNMQHATSKLERGVPIKAFRTAVTSSLFVLSAQSWCIHHHAAGTLLDSSSKSTWTGCTRSMSHST